MYRRQLWFIEEYGSPPTVLSSNMDRGKLRFEACSYPSGKSPYGHGRLFVNSRYSPDCGVEPPGEECWFPLRPYALT